MTPGDALPDVQHLHHAGGQREPIASDVDGWFAELDRFANVPLSEPITSVETQYAQQPLLRP